MATLLRMPSLSPTMEMGAIGSWNKKVGDFVEVGDVLAEVETDKAVMDYEIVDEGYVRKLLVEPGREIAVGTPIAILAESMEEDIAPAEAAATSPAAGPANGGGRAQPSAGQAADAPPPAPAAAPSPPASPPPAPSQPPTDPAPAAPAAQAAISSPVAIASPAAISSPATAPAAGEAANGGRIRISPYGRKVAEEHQLDWHTLAGSGPGGRIIAADVEAALAGGAATAQPVAPAGRPEALFEDLPLSMMRKAIAKKMEHSKRTVPHFQATRKVRAERLVAAREALNREFGGEAKISVNDMILKACAVALREHPLVNSQFLGDSIRRFNTVDICVAVGTQEGLITPVVRDVDRKGLREVSAEVRALAARAREKKLAPEEYNGGTFTVSNLGMYGVTEFNGIINTPQACILAVSAIVREPVVEGERLVAGQTMNITLSSDHRVVDGLTAAQFLATLSKILENPVAMVL